MQIDASIGSSLKTPSTLYGGIGFHGDMMLNEVRINVKPDK
jgi:hypothetical protein